jgi:putative peptide zinc metalloprotease protein
MGEPLLSPHWHRVASLHPRLAGSVTITAQQVRNERWYVIADRVSGRQLRVNALGHELVGRLDGRLTLQQIWDALVWRLGEDTLSQHEVLHIVSTLAEAGMLISENTPYLGTPRDAGRRRHRGSGLGVLSMKIPVLDPTPVLARLAWLSPILFRRASLAVWALMMLAAVVLVGLHWGSLQDYADQHLLGRSNLMWSWLLYPIIKLCHEVAHGLAVRRWGGEVREMGVALFLIVPVPYVDASAASVFPEKHRRMLVSAAGILVETTLAVVALLVWLATNDGAVREAAFAAMSIAGLSTVLVNANPLMRYDGYHLLADALELPNLAPRSSTWLRYAGERYLLGNRRLREPQVRPGERPWLIGYGIASTLYRFVFFAGVIAWIGSKYLLAGAAFALLAVVNLLVLPLARLIHHAVFGARLRAVRLRAAMTVLSLVVVGGYALFAWPVPMVARTEGVVWIPEDAHVRNATEGTVERVLAHDGDTVTVGQPLLELSSPELHARRDQLQARLHGRQLAHSALLLVQPGTAAAISKEIGKLVAELGEVDRLRAALVVRSPYDGVLAWSGGEELAGRYVARGSTLGKVLPRRSAAVRALVPQDDADLLSQSPRRIEVRFAQDRTRSHAAVMTAQTPAPSLELPSPALGDRAGGPFAVHPMDADGSKSLAPNYVVDLEVPQVPLTWAGARAWVRIEYAPMPPVAQLMRRMRQVFVSRLGGDDAVPTALDPF